MLKRVLLAAAVIAASPALVQAQDLFWSFSNTAAQSTAVAPAGTVTGTAYVFSAPTFGFDAIDLNLNVSDPNVIQINGGTPTNPTFNAVGGVRFDSSVLTTDGTGNGNLFSVNITQNGVNPALGPLFDPDFVAGVGVLLAEVDFSIVGSGNATLGFSLGDQGALALPDTVLTPAFGEASFTVEDLAVIPEPSSLALLVLGSVGLVARRKRS